MTGQMMKKNKCACVVRKVVCVSLAMVFAWSSVMPRYAFAGRSAAGGGDLAKFDGGKIAMNAAISIGSSIAIGAIGSGLKNIGGQITGSATTGFGSSITNSLTNSFKFDSLVSGYNGYMMSSQSGRTIGIMGARYGWSKSDTYLYSAFASGLTVGLVNAAAMTGTSAATFGGYVGNMGRGALIGGGSQMASAYVVLAIDGDKIDKGEDPGVWAQIAGYATGVVSAGALRSITNPNTYTQVSKIFTRSAKIDMPASAATPSSDITGTDFTSSSTDLLDSKYTYNEVLSVDKSGKPTVIGDQVVNFERDLYNRNQLGSEESVLSKYDVPQSVIDQLGPEGTVLVKQGVSQRALDLAGYDTSNMVKVDRLGQDTYKLTSQERFSLTRGLGNIAEATFVTPFNAQNLPSLLGAAAGIYASSFLSKDEKYLRPLVQGATSAVVQPVVGGLMNVAGLDPALYLGAGSNVVESRMRYASTIATMAKQDYMDGVKKTVSAQSNLLDKEIKGIQSQPIDQTAKNKQIDEAIARYNYKLSELSLANSKLGEGPTNNLYNVIDSRAIQTDPEKADLLNKNVVTYGSLNRDRIVALENKMFEDNQKTQGLDQTLTMAHTSRPALMGSYMFSTLKSGLLEAAFSGGVSAGLTKALDADNDKSTNTLSQILISNAANVAGAVGRGIAWNLNYDSVSKDYIWQQRGEFERPKPYASSPNEKSYNVMDDMISRTNYANQLESYESRIDITGGVEKDIIKTRLVLDSAGKPIIETDATGKPMMSPLGGYEYKKEKFNVGPGLTIASRDEKPNMYTAIGASIEQANTEYTTRFLSFGAPALKASESYGITPEQVTPAAAFSYLQTVQYLGGLGNAYGLQRVFSYSATQAAMGAASNSIMGAVTQLPGVGSTFNLQPQRFVIMEGHYKDPKDGEIKWGGVLSGLPVTIESGRFFTNNSGLPGMETVLWGPFPNAFYSPRPVVGESDYLRRRSINAAQASASLPAPKP